MQAVNERHVSETVRDVVSLAKPRITLMVLITTAGGLSLAGGVDLRTALYTLLGTALVVGSANTLNCWLERDIDRLMARTRNRPLPAGRLSPAVALMFGLVLGGISIPLLTLGVNRLTGLLAAIALVSYVAVYTPLKQKTPAALLIGSVPGALPPLIGWTAATGRLEWAGIALFGVLFFWQLPHFIAIAIFREDEYTRAGFRVLPAVRGLRVAKVHAVVHSLLLLAVTVSLVPLHVAGTLYLIVALALGGSMVALSLRGFWVGVEGRARAHERNDVEGRVSAHERNDVEGRVSARERSDAGARWARQLFAASLVYLPLLFAALALDSLT